MHEPGEKRHEGPPSDAPVLPGFGTAASARSGLPDVPDLTRVLLDSMTEGVSLSAEDGTILYTNPAEDRMFGYALGELIGQHVSVQNGYPPEENARIVGEVIAELKRSGAWKGEWLNRRKDGSTFVTASRISASTSRGDRTGSASRRTSPSRPGRRPNCAKARHGSSWRPMPPRWASGTGTSRAVA